MIQVPKTGEVWRHYKGGLYTIVGVGRDEDGFVNVVYTDYQQNNDDDPSLFVQMLSRFFQEVENNKPRFMYAPSIGMDNVCPFIRSKS